MCPAPLAPAEDQPVSYRSRHAIELIPAIAAALALSFPVPALAQDWSPSRPDSHAPIGVMGDHVHEAGEWMLAVRVMTMPMDGNRDGTTELARSEVLAQYPVSPIRMPMAMYMLGGMYAPSDRVTLLAMVPVTDLSMDHVTRSGVEFTTQAGGLGDVSIGALVGVAEGPEQRLHLNAAVSLPTGSVTRRGDTPVAADVILPYPMQLGSGTWDLKPGLTWLGQSGDWGYGAQGIATFRTGENDEGYRLGHRVEATGWVSRVLAPWSSVSLRLGLQRWGDIDGASSALNPMMVPTADPLLRAGRTVDLAGGLNLYVREGAAAGHRIALEFGAPVYQSLDGPQLQRNWTLTVGWQKAFGG